MDHISTGQIAKGETSQPTNEREGKRREVSPTNALTTNSTNPKNCIEKFPTLMRSGALCGQFTDRKTRHPNRRPFSIGMCPTLICEAGTMGRFFG